MTVRLASAALVLPIYRQRLDSGRLHAVDRAVAVLRHGDWHFVGPQSLDTEFYEQRYGVPVVRYADSCFESVHSFNNLLLSDAFYASFERYDFMLLVHDDAYVLRDDLPVWLSSPYDYVGAPWPNGIDVNSKMPRRARIQRRPLKVYVGNGGFSLRRIRTCRALLEEFPDEAAWFRKTSSNEDVFFSALGQMSRRFVLPSLRVAAGFAWETEIAWLHDLCEGQIPMAAHGHLGSERDFFRRVIQPRETPVSDAGGVHPPARERVGVAVHEPRPDPIDPKERAAGTVVVMPIYGSRLDGERLTAVDRALAVLRDRDWYFIAPESLPTGFYEQRYGKPILRFADRYFTSAANSNALLLADETYAAFARYEFLLMVQDDVYLVRDDLDDWTAQPFDYVGAPWPRGSDLALAMSAHPALRAHALRAYVGNGGFSLRRIAACRRLLAEFSAEAEWCRTAPRGEDLFFALFGQVSRAFVLPTLRVAAAFAWEVSPAWMYAFCEGDLPMAIHAYRKYEPEFFQHTILPAVPAPPDAAVPRAPLEGRT